MSPLDQGQLLWVFGEGGHFWALQAHSTHEMSCNSGKHQVRSAPSAAHDRFKDAENETHIF